MASFPSLFVSHGAPSLAIDKGPAHEFLRGLGQYLGKPDLIIMLSAHHDLPGPDVSNGPKPETLYDFGGFPDELRQIKYAAPGAPEVAAQLVVALKEAGYAAVGDPEKGFDHGAWVPLYLMYPEADIPVIQISIDSRQSPRWHYDLGKTLSSLRDQGVLIMGSGSATHNLKAVFSGRHHRDDQAEPWATSYAEWIAEQVLTGDEDALIDAETLAPHAKDNHPTPEHILPFYVALGAGDEAAGQRLHASTTYGVLAMDVYAFGEVPVSLETMTAPKQAETRLYQPESR